MSSAQTRIIGAFLFGIIMVGGAFMLNKTEQAAADQQAIDSVTALNDRKHIPVTDSNQDGVPDWQANLIDTEPIYLDATSSEPYEPPDTLTGQYSIKIFNDVMTLDAYGLLEDTRTDYADAVIAELEEVTKPISYTASDLSNIVQVTSKSGLEAYGNLVAGTIFFYQTDEDDELTIFQRMTQDENPKHLEKLAVIEQQYNDMITALLELEVPEKYVFEHLAIVNSFSALRQNVIGMQLYFEDPLYTVTRYRQLITDVVGMNTAIQNLYDALYLDENINFTENGALPVLVELIQ